MVGKASKRGDVYIGNTDSIMLLMFFLYGLLSQYFVLTITAGISAIVIFRYLWKPYVPPVLLFFISFHWLQVFASVLYADFMRQPIHALFGSLDSDFLFFMTFLHIIAMAFVIHRYVVGKGEVVTLDILKEAAEKLNTRNVIIGYFVAAFIMPFLVSFSINSPSLYQLVLSFGIIKVMFAALLFFIFLLKKTKNKLLIIGILIFDFVMSFASFFSDFKTVLIMVMIVYFTVYPRVKRDTLYKIIPVALLLLIFFSFWSYVKGSYRDYLNQGSFQQVQKVSDAEALAYLFDKASDINLAALQDGAALFLSRVQYMERYSEVYARVPDEVPHTDGDELAYAAEFLLIPRFLNPDKGVKDASQRTSYYTGKRFSNASQGTSISMGYFCDLYIDFGLYVMFIPLIGIAAVFGLLYRKILDIKKYNLIYVYGLLIGTFLTMGTFESDTLFFLGVLRNNIAFLIAGYFTFFPWLNKFITNK